MTQPAAASRANPRRRRAGERVVIVGGGLTGCTLAHRLADAGIASLILERAGDAGGLIRSAHLEGVLYEPHGSHIFHTDDAEVWELANAMTPFNDYRHRVDILAAGEVFNWPILASEIDRHPDGVEIRTQLNARRGVDAAARAQAADFEEWCLDLMGPILYERFVRPYTEKQWGRPACQLSARWAPRRVAVRWDDDPYLFPDAYQGWPSGPNGYNDLVEGLLDHPLIELRTGCDVSLTSLERDLSGERPAAILLSCPLDAFCAERLGPLEWRGVDVRHVHLPQRRLAQGAMVVNYPGPEFPFIRVHETKHASRQEIDGTVLGFEFTGAAARHYPVERERNRALNDAYQRMLRETLGERVFFAGRLAAYAYLDMDDCMRQAIDVAAEVLAFVGRPS